MNIKEQAKTNFVKYLQSYFDQQYDEFTIKRIKRMLDDFDQAIPKVFVSDKASYDKGYHEGFDEAKKIFQKKINDGNNISSVLL